MTGLAKFVLVGLSDEVLGDKFTGRNSGDGDRPLDDGQDDLRKTSVYTNVISLGKRTYLANCPVDSHLNRALKVGVGVQGGELGADGDTGEEARQDVLDMGSEDALGVGRTRGA